MTLKPLSDFYIQTDNATNNINSLNTAIQVDGNVGQPIKDYEAVTAIIRSALLSDERLVAWDRWTGGAPSIYPAYLDFTVNGTFPCITIHRDYGRTLKNRTGYQDLYYYIHGWFKSPSDTTSDYNPVSDCIYLAQLIIDILDVTPDKPRQIPQFAMCRLVDSVFPIYEKDTRTTYFMTRWLIKANKSIAYATD